LRRDPAEKGPFFGDSNRRRIIEMLASSGKLSAKDISKKVKISPLAVSQHVKILREARLVEVEKRAKESIMNKVTSQDGTQIAYDRQGEGQALILIDGAMCYRAFGPMQGLAELLAPHFTVYWYDRRGRGDSGDTKPYTVVREVEDIEALIDKAGGSASLFGVSSGGALALEAAIKLGDKVKKLAIYEAPYDDDPDSRQAWKEYSQKLSSLIAADRRGDAAALFMSFVGTPENMIDGMRSSPAWTQFEFVAPTLAYDRAVLGTPRSVPIERAACLRIPALVMNGDASFPFMYDTAVALAKAIPQAEHRVLEGQRHDASREVLAPELEKFFAA
jgi:pimeloyl-ACP methyl ester carboxylesterase